MDEQFNLTPSPALLDLLGKIPFKGWQCIAELIDNSIDAIINSPYKLENRQKVVTVYIPTKSKIESNLPLIVEDWGSGMNEKQLENAVRAGFSDKKTSSNLGLFGMGFNVATSRLANTVNVWTSTQEMKQEIGVCIDIKEMKKTGSFIRPKLEREKRSNKRSGTTIEIYDFKPDADKLLKRKEIISKINRAYSERIFEAYGIKIFVNNEEIKPFKFCVWDAGRTVTYKHDETPTLIEIDELIKEELFCDDCFSWISDTVETSTRIECPICNTVGKIRKKDIYISGWVGIQRYSDTEHYGVDISRNGRILSTLDKSFFYWNKDDNDDPRFNPEYPRDTPQAGGRIVGQIEANFLIPMYTKDNFEREDRNWILAVNKIRGEMPLQPELASDKGYKVRNRSPIGRLFSAYRKVSPPGRKNLIFAKADGSADYITPRSWAHNFYAGNEEYRDDSKWWEAVTKSDLKEDSSTFNPLDPVAGEKKDDSDSGGAATKVEEREKYPGKQILKTIKKYDIENLLNERPIEITLIEYYPDNDIPKPIIFEPRGPNKYFVYLNNHHPLFRDFADGFEDLLLMEIAYRYSALKNPEDWPISRVYYELKSRYAAETMLSVPNLVNRANDLIRKVQNHLVRGEGIILPRKPNLNDSDIKIITKKYLNLEGKNVQHPVLLLVNSQYLKYLDLNYVFRFIKDFPELIFDDNIFSLPYSELDDENKKIQFEKYLNYFNDVKWFINDLAKEGDEAIKKLKPQIIRNRISIDILYESITK